MKKYQENIVDAFFSVLNTNTHGMAYDRTMAIADGIAYSYKTPIAKLVKSEGKWVCRMVKEQYSNTTARQKGAIRLYASRAGVPVVEVDSL